MDIRLLQRAIVDGLEDVKAQDIAVFDTEKLSALFERVIIASGTSNRQTKALASSVREKVREQGGRVLSIEGEDNGEWIIVDCGAAVVHIMQPAIRTYYHLEEIWGEKPIKLKAAAKRGLVKASEPADAAPSAAPVKAAARKAPAKKATTLAQAVALKQAGSRTAAKKAPARKAAPAKTAPAKKAPAAKAPAKQAPTKTAPTKKVVARKAPVKTVAAKAPSRKAPAKKAAAKPTAARKRSA